MNERNTRKDAVDEGGNKSGPAAVRVRFAPSPTGELHLGGARTALYNWLFARHKKGRFVLRIEDTDQNRSTEEAINTIISSLEWLGLDWDEGPGKGGDYGPYRQTERAALYKEWAARLIKTGKAYRCYCLPDELAEQRKQAVKDGRSFQYDRCCRYLDARERRKAEEKNPKPVLRFAVPLEGETGFEDMIRGSVSFQNRDIDDFIIMRSDATATYNFVVVVDDVMMKITHVIRGEDHLSNTPKQILLYQAMGVSIPWFGHLALILGPDKKPLSKRFGATSVLSFRDRGFLPEALLNYLALLGWSYDEKSTLFSKEELIEKFSVEKVSKNPAVFDLSKLEWMNGHYLRELSLSNLAERILPLLVSSGRIKDEKNVDLRQLKRIISICQERIKTLNEFIEMTEFFFREQPVFDQKEAQKVRSFEPYAKILLEAEQKLSSLKDFDCEGIEKTLRQICQESGISASKGLQPIRFAITGRLISPPLFETMEILGKQRCIDHLRIARRELAKKLF